ncbi:MAG: argininosuccinate lyase [Phototrophicaceae bacterium]
MADSPKTFPHPLYEKTVLQPFFKDAEKYYYEPMLAANKTHAVMLYRCGIITQENAAALLQAFAQIEADGLENLGYQSGVEDLFFAMENKIISLIGAAYGGNLQLARSRNDLGYALTRLALRPMILQTMSDLTAFRATLLAFARDHINTLMPGYTHTQPAQPHTMAHYITGILSVLERDMSRLVFAYDTNNQSPLGAAALTGTGFPIDRQLSADLTGFDGVMASTYDGIATSDNLTDVAAVTNSIGVNLSRFTKDMLFMATQESGAIRIDDSFIQISSIMPQKRNPVVLEHIRARISRMIAYAQGINLQCHNIPFGDTQDIEDEIFPLLFGSLETAQDILELYTAVMATLTVNVEHLQARAIAGFTTVTELADTLVREANLPFRQAHSIVSGMVTYALQNKLNPTDLTSDMMKQVSVEKIGREVVLSDEILKKALDPQAFVDIRTVQGGTSAIATSAVLDDLEETIHADLEYYDATITKLNIANKRLAEHVQAIINEGTE